MRLDLMLAAACALALAACGGPGTSSALANVPDAAGLTVEAQGGAAEGLALSAATSGVAPQAALASFPHGVDLAATRARIAAVNAGIEHLLAEVAAVAKENGAPGPGEVTTYGPVARCVVPASCDAGGTATLRLRVVHAAADVWGFALEAEVGTGFERVAAGWLRRGAVERRGAGQVALNLDNLRRAAPAYPGQGLLVGGFANGPVAKALRYRVRGFTPDAAQWAPATATFSAFKTAEGVTRVRAAAIDDFYGDPANDELGFGHAAFHPGVGGRAYAVVTDYVDASGVAHGDVPPSDAGAPQYFFGRACYAPGATVAKYGEWFLCPKGVGPRACVDAQGGAGTPAADYAGATWQSACALSTEPPELAAPATPAATDDPAAAEAGEDATGLVPEATPASTDVTPPAA